MMMLMLQQLEMHQPIPHEQPRQQQSTTVVQPIGAAQPVFYAVPSAPAVPELYDSGQSKVVGSILIIAGVMSLVFRFISIISFSTANVMIYFLQGLVIGIMVSSCALWCFL